MPRGPVLLLPGALLAVGLAWTAACATFGSSEAPLDPDAGPGVDAAALLEAGPGVDASPPVDAGPQGCARQADASFCVDFEEPAPFAPTLWTNPLTDTPEGTIRLTQTGAVSPPNAALFTVPDGGASNCSYLQLTRRFGGAHAQVRAHASVRIDAPGPFLTVTTTASADLGFVFLVRVDDTTVNIALQRTISGGTSEVEGASGAITFDTSPYPQLLDVALDLRMPDALGTDTGTGTLTVGAKSTLVTLPSDYVLTDAVLGIGPFCQSAPQRMVADDVAAWVTP